MSTAQILVVVSLVLMAAVAIAVGYLFLGASSKRQVNLRGLMGTRGLSGGGSVKDELALQEAEDRIQQIKEQSGVAVAKTDKNALTSRLFRAGFFTARDKARYQTVRVISFIIGPIACVGLMYFVAPGKPMFVMLGAVLGVLIGVMYPNVYLDRAIAKREEEIMYFLPLVIEQISIAVSSALDIGPSIAQILSMATDRDSHNPITEMFIHVEKLMRSGLNLEDSLIEVGEATGMTDVKHAFMFLAQCAKHGGEISRQLQELADAVMTQRQVQVEARIAALPVKATGPLTMVFAGFFGLLFAGLLVRLMSAFGS